jgi:hypothetical protein
MTQLNAEEIKYIISGLNCLASLYDKGSDPSKIMEKSVRQALLGILPDDSVIGDVKNLYEFKLLIANILLQETKEESETSLVSGFQHLMKKSRLLLLK